MVVGDDGHGLFAGFHLALFAGVLKGRPVSPVGEVALEGVGLLSGSEGDDCWRRGKRALCAEGHLMGQKGVEGGAEGLSEWGWGLTDEQLVIDVKQEDGLQRGVGGEGSGAETVHGPDGEATGAGVQREAQELREGARTV